MIGFGVFAVHGFSQDAAELNDKLAVVSVAASGMSKSDIQINPNPVSGETFTIELQNLQKGKYSIFMYDEKGRKYLVKILNVEEGTSTELLQLPKKADKGVYILQVISKTSRFSKKVIVE